jgi:nicotinate-nucleotide pyrophosphorylase (carboxylating)
MDNFSLEMLKEAVAINRTEGQPPAELEASGGLTLADVSDIAKTGVDYISVGALTKNIQAIDFSMRFR